MPQTPKPRYQLNSTIGFFCPHCGRAIVPSMRLSYPAPAIGQFAPVYRCACGKHIGEPISFVSMTTNGSTIRGS